MKPWVALVLSACGGASTAPTVCDPSHERVGRYVVHAQARSGQTCGALSDESVTVAGTGASATSAPPACESTSNRWSDDGCRADFQAQCEDATATGYLIQETQDGSQLWGEETITTPMCTATYDVTWTRQ